MILWTLCVQRLVQFSILEPISYFCMILITCQNMVQNSCILLCLSFSSVFKCFLSFLSPFFWVLSNSFKVLGRKRRLSFPLPFFRRMKPTIALIGCGRFPFQTFSFIYLSHGAIIRRMFDPNHVALASAELMFRSAFKNSSLNDI